MESYRLRMLVGGSSVVFLVAALSGAAARSQGTGAQGLSAGAFPICTRRCAAKSAVSEDLRLTFAGHLAHAGAQKSDPEQIGNAPLSAQEAASRPLVTKAEYDRWHKELSNWGRWGPAGHILSVRRGLRICRPSADAQG